MATLFDDASLVMIPSGYKDDKLYSIKPTSGDGDFTFSRDGSGASPATRVNASGLIEKGRTNEVLQSNQFDTTWVLTAGTSLTSGQSGYDGSSDAWLMTSDGVSGFAPISQNITFSGVSTFSIYAKEGTNQYISLRSLGATDVRAIFNLNTGALHSSSNTIATNITSIGSGWYRLEMVLNASNTSVVIYPNILGTASAGNIYIQDAQLEKGLVATSYIETTTAAASAGILGDMPRLDYSGGATCPSLLLEPARTNLVTQSEYFDPTFNESSGVSWEANATISPEGVSNAAKLNNSNASTQGAYNVSMSFTNNDTMVASIFAKEGSNNNLRFGISNQIESRHIYYNFNLAEGTFVFAAETGGMINYSADMIDYGNGWYRCVVIGTFPSSGVTSGGVYPRIIGNGYLYLYGLQVEKNVSYPTSYVPTYGSATARAGDVCNGAGDSSLFNDSEGVLFVETAALADDGTSRRISISSGATSNRVEIVFQTTGRIDYQVTSGNLFQAGGFGLVTQTDTNKIAVKYKANDFALWINGTEASTDSSGSTPVGISQMRFEDGGGGTDFYGKVKQAIYFDSALTDAELATLTTL